MKHRNGVPPLIELSVVDIICIYINNGLIVDPKVFGLKEFSFDELLGEGFHMEGDSSFCLFEKEFRLKDGKHIANAKIYFSNEGFVSNGFDFWSGRLVSILSCLGVKCNDERFARVTSMDFLVDEDFNFGSLIINNCLDVRFLRRAGRRNRFKISGISTDFQFEKQNLRPNVNTGFARAIKKEISVYAAKKRFKYDLGINELAGFLINEFPAVVR